MPGFIRLLDVQLGKLCHQNKMIFFSSREDFCLLYLGVTSTQLQSFSSIRALDFLKSKCGLFFLVTFTVMLSPFEVQIHRRNWFTWTPTPKS